MGVVVVGVGWDGAGVGMGGGGFIIDLRTAQVYCVAIFLTC